MGCNMVFSELVKEVGEWSQHNFGNQKGAGALAPLAGIVEEVGELQEAVSAEDKIDAFVDMTIFLADVCARSGVVVRHVLLGRHGAQPFNPAVSLGKLSHAVLKLHQGIRGANKEDVREAARQLIKDIVSGYYHSLSLVLGGVQNVEPFDQQVEKVWNKVKLRDWKKWPETGRPPEPKATGPTTNTASIAEAIADYTRDKQLQSLISNKTIDSLGILSYLQSQWYKTATPTTFEQLAKSNGNCRVAGAGTGQHFTTRRLGPFATAALATFPQLDEVRIAQPLDKSQNLRCASRAEIFKQICEYPTRKKVYMEVPSSFKTPRMNSRTVETLSNLRVLGNYQVYGEYGTEGVGPYHKYQYDCCGYYK